MGLTNEQRFVAKRIHRVAKKRNRDRNPKNNVSRREVISALETGLVESNLRNLDYGDRDSVGWRQERGHYGPVSERRKLGKSINRFYDETNSERGNYRTAGQLAQAVQRSAHPGRYDARKGQAVDILKWLKGSSGTPAQGRARTKVTKTVTPGADTSEMIAQGKASYLANRHDPDALLNYARVRDEAKAIERENPRRVKVSRKVVAGGRERAPAKPGSGPRRRLRAARTANKGAKHVGGVGDARGLFLRWARPRTERRGRWRCGVGTT